jgi:NAD(P)H-dependent flavin oxidoreductase YrpB (nitropropane dioxygenase family)
MDLRDYLGIEQRVIQAPSVAHAELATAVSRAGGLGTINTIRDPARFRAELRACRTQLEGRPFSANLLMPFVRRAHVEACLAERVPVVSMFYGFDARVVEALHAVGARVLHQVGSAEEARRALHDGADGLIAQGIGAGGHLRATEPLATIVPKLVALAGDKPVLASGGIHDRATAQRAIALGASGVWVGTRFLLTYESHAHDVYKQRLLDAETTFETLLFGLGWHAPHRVVPNGATKRWCAHDPRGPRTVRAFNRAIEPLTRWLPANAGDTTVARQRLQLPLYTAAPLTRGMNERLVEVTPLYAGDCVPGIRTLIRAAEVVHDLSV